MKILAIHGLGDHRDGQWKNAWRYALSSVVPERHGRSFEIDFFEYDWLFEEIDLSFWDTTVALGKLAGSGAWHGLFGEAREGRFGAARPEGLFDGVADKLRWTAGYVVAWVQDREFRERVREFLLDRIGDVRPDVILAHSLGSLISYDALASRDARDHRHVGRLLSRLTYISMGSQIGNPFVRGNLLPGRILPLSVEAWYHLYNREDDVFTAPISLPGVDNFTQVQTYFDVDGWADHSATEYIKHTATRYNVWRPLSQQFRTGGNNEARTSGCDASPRANVPSGTAKSGPKKRALLIGIDEYPDPALCLAGCVNDVYLMSSLLQEHGFGPDSIRIVLNHRATANGIRNRLEWLLEDPRPGDQLVLFFSGHGATIPAYDYKEEVDHLDEALVPYDFDWSPEKAIIDNQIFDLYSQLPYDTDFSIFLDCCHAGGMHRSGTVQTRGISPPEDIRHRSLAWNTVDQRWEPRGMTQKHEHFASPGASEMRELYLGTNMATNRIGRATELRNMDYKTYSNITSSASDDYVTPSEYEDFGTLPYLPVIFQSSRENELSVEYTNGTQSYGAFTYFLAQCIRRGTHQRDKLLQEVQNELRQQGISQTPQMLMPAQKRNDSVF